MKVLLVSIKSGSGSDVYYKLLKQGLDKYTDIKSDLIFIPHIFEKIFFLIPLYLRYKKIDFSRYDIIHTNAEFGWWFKKKNKKLIVTIHNFIFDKEFQKCSSIFQKAFYYLIVRPNLKKSLLTANKIIAVSRYTKDNIVDYFKLKKKNIKVIYNGIDTQFFKPLGLEKKDKKTKILFVGNLIKRKGVDLLPKIMAKLNGNYELYFTSGLRIDKVPKYLLKEKNMTPLGKLSHRQLVVVYNKCDVVLLPSRLEGFPYVPIEAMSCGKPVIVTDLPFFRESIKEGKNGYLCRINDVDDFVEKIKVVRKRLANGNNFLNNCDYVRKEFSLEIMIKNILNLYKFKNIKDKK